MYFISQPSTSYRREVNSGLEGKFRFLLRVRTVVYFVRDCRSHRIVSINTWSQHRSCIDAELRQAVMGSSFSVLTSRSGK